MWGGALVGLRMLIGCWDVGVADEHKMAGTGFTQTKWLEFCIHHQKKNLMFSLKDYVMAFWLNIMDEYGWTDHNNIYNKHLENRWDKFM